MLLSSELAQRIVTMLLPISHHNVNVMDHRGIIIASGQPGRVNDFHKGALDVITTGETITIYPETLQQFPGSLPGINMPITFEEQIIGVVGVSGHPTAVQATAALVKAVVELILEREMLRERFRSQANSEEHFLGLLLSESAAARAQELQRMARMLQINLPLPRLVAVVDAGPFLEDAHTVYGKSALVTARIKEQLIREVRNSHFFVEEDMAVLMENQLILVKYLGDEDWAAALDAWTQNLMLRLNEKFDLPVRIGVGSLCASPFLLHHSYMEALFCLNHCEKGKVAAIYDFSMLADYLLLPKRHMPEHPIVMLRRKFENADLKRYDMKRSLAALLDCQLNVQQAAKMLFIHRNTLLFRLEKLRQATTLDPCHHFDHAVLCRVLFGDSTPGTEDALL